PSGPAVRQGRDVAGQHDEESRYGHPFRAQDLPLFQLTDCAPAGQPHQFLPGRLAHGLVGGEPIDQICWRHGRIISAYARVLEVPGSRNPSTSTWTDAVCQLLIIELRYIFIV